MVAQRVEEELRKRQSPPAARDGSANLFASSGTGSANQQLFANLSERLGGPARAATGAPPPPSVMPESPLGNLNPTQQALLVQLLQNVSPTQQAPLLELLQTEKKAGGKALTVGELGQKAPGKQIFGKKFKIMKFLKETLVLDGKVKIDGEQVMLV